MNETRRGAQRAGQRRRRKEEKERQLAALRAQLEAGIRALDAGDFDEVEGSELEQYLARLM